MQAPAGLIHRENILPGETTTLLIYVYSELPLMNNGESRPANPPAARGHVQFMGVRVETCGYRFFEIRFHQEIKKPRSDGLTGAGGER
jgi:hypothetical protein